jgi:hypothetical protein
VFLGALSCLECLSLIVRIHLVHEIRSAEGRVARPPIREQEPEWNSDAVSPAVELEPEVGVAVEDYFGAEPTHLFGNEWKGAELLRHVAISTDDLAETLCQDSGSREATDGKLLFHGFAPSLHKPGV